MAQEHQFWKWGCITLMVLIAAVAAVVWKGLDGMGGIIDHTKDVVIVHTEGGKEASLLLDSPGGGLQRHGFSAAGVLLSSMGENLELPNILGAVRVSRP